MNGLIILIFVTGFSSSGAIKSTFMEHIGPVYCISDWTCNNYCFPYDKVPCCASLNKMGAEVKFGTCHCCETWTQCNDQAALGCGSCTEIYTRSNFDFKETKACPKKTSGSIFSSIFSKQAIMAERNSQDEEAENFRLSERHT